METFIQLLGDPIKKMRIQNKGFSAFDFKFYRKKSKNFINGLLQRTNGLRISNELHNKLPERREERLVSQNKLTSLASVPELHAC